ncbi:hypothetical protein M231_01769 [Tremella mesenterica]|uniref:BZIP domain-containing protein n=1 Tax=Tremella mesenterica TaxID=5217 RepID=A0A4Q1BSB5_TREME|nr:uncharacterized protein TREMEDRAFT_71070 [Tremella mesenterica DSM 1558]EIW71134.1 hypothetical protein TREMEDRAFT_71070 [Tremella mesenterica DSM 1558]RXK40921.1 hypothetical protein M231_01769 [Tremella mesenterica]
MSFDLPAHLQGLNTLTPSPRDDQALVQDQEQEFWAYLHADDLFKNFGTNEAYPGKLTPAVNDKKPEATTQLPSLSDFIAKFVSDSTPAGDDEDIAARQLPYPFAGGYSPATGASTLPNTPRTGLPLGLVNTADVMPRPHEEDERISGAKKLKQIGAGPEVIQEDKRRRNTEASARFRAKKKEREQAVEQQNKILQAQVAELSAQKQRLESENTLLRQIVLHGKAGAVDGGELAGLFAGLKRRRED